MTKDNNIKNRILLFILLFIYPVVCKISLDMLKGFNDDFKLGFVYWGKYIFMFIMVLYAIAGQYLIKRIIQEKWVIGIVLTLIILIIYSSAIFLWLLPVEIQPLISFFVLLCRPEYVFVPVFLLVNTIAYLIYGNRKKATLNL